MKWVSSFGHALVRKGFGREALRPHPQVLTGSGYVFSPPVP